MCSKADSTAPLSPTAMVIRELRRFLASEKPEVISIRGRWGVGKTYAWNEALKAAASEDNIGLGTYSFVSLFGVTSLDQLKFSIFESRTSGAAIGTGANMETLVIGFDAAIRSFGTKALEAIAGKNASDLVQSGAFLMVRNQIVCIDDIERKGKDLRIADVLGLVSMLREQRNCKIVIILNEEQLDEKEELARYHEKVIERSLVYAPTPEETVQIALKDNVTFGPLLGDCCARLKLSNIRIMKKIEALVWQIHPALKDYDPAILKGAIHALALLGWAHYSEHERDAPADKETKPSNHDLVEFILKRHGPSLCGTTKNYTKEEERWEAFLRMYKFERADESDVLLNQGITNGYFDEDGLRKLADKATAGLQQLKAADDWNAVWDRLHDSFDDDADKFVSELQSAFAGYLQHINIGYLNHSVKILKRLGRNAEADALIKLFKEKKEEPQENFDLRPPENGL